VKLIVYEFDLMPDICGLDWIRLDWVRENGPMSNSARGLQLSRNKTIQLLEYCHTVDKNTNKQHCKIKRTLLLLKSDDR